MKKIVSLILVACMLFAFAGCGASGKEVLKVALSPDFAPMEFVDVSKSGQDAYVGFDVTLANFIADELGMELEIVPMSFNACQVAVETKSVDMSISGFSWTEQRAENYNLSDYYYAGDNETEQVIVTTKENEGKFTSAADFSGLKVAAQTASLQLDLCKSQLPEDCEIVEVGDLTTAFLQLKNGDFDALALATGNAEVFIANNPNDVAMSGFIFEVDPKYTANVILLNKDSDDLLAKVNEILAKAYENGYYDVWYEEALALAEGENAADVSYDDEGNVANG
ncbi:MAG: transporter substrate-binding domain-containing protein [Oscillospiraceae bacterium]|nr:transporter substrate-binding domain-containing protein [Oscillospiraceae bacterium]MBQ5323798.1 transporter substrate-binding domain-containing protein [Oscillospiraceae bacterium]MBQ8594861.1 transporter substrate-binding domain-containing protein [Oscillospiraceae bacterium]